MGNGKDIVQDTIDYKKRRVCLKNISVYSLLNMISYLSSLQENNHISEMDSILQ